jgi:hypothetical protein
MSHGGEVSASNQWKAIQEFRPGAAALSFEEFEIVGELHWEGTVEKFRAVARYHRDFGWAVMVPPRPALLLLPERGYVVTHFRPTTPGPEEEG